VKARDGFGAWFGSADLACNTQEPLE
jgi:hypothetical protein